LGIEIFPLLLLLQGWQARAIAEKNDNAPKWYKEKGNRKARIWASSVCPFQIPWDDEEDGNNKIKNGDGNPTPISIFYVWSSFISV
jgi:hypothetical protein